MIVCPRCSKENQDHYKFCLGCGSELPREATSPRAFSPRTPPSAMSTGEALSSAAAAADNGMPFARTQQGSASDPPPPVGGLGSAARVGSASMPPLAVPAPAGAGAGAAMAARSIERANSAAPAAISSTSPNNCPSCGNPVPIDFKFCGTCGHRMPAAAAVQSVPAAPAAVAKPGRGALVVINPDGSEGGSFPLADGATTVGREAGSLFAADAYLSPVHATFTLEGDACAVKDEHSLNGVYVRLKRDTPTKLHDGDVFRIGQELIRFDAMLGPQFVNGVEPMGSPNPGYVGRLCLVIGRDSTGNAYPIAPDGIHLGRERGDVIFPEDGYVSGLHCRVHYDGASCVLTDVGSSNGTFLRVCDTRTLVPGDLLLMGQQLFRVQY